METANLKIAISALFIESLLSSFTSPSDSGNDVLDRLLGQIGEIYRPQERPLVRRIVLPCHNAKSRFSVFATWETTVRNTFDAENTLEMIRFPRRDYQQACLLCLTTFPRVACLKGV